MDQTKMICVGDHIETINGKNVSDRRHYEVAKMLKDLEKGQMFKLELIEPMKAFGELPDCPPCSLNIEIPTLHCIVSLFSDCSQVFTQGNVTATRKNFFFFFALKWEIYEWIFFHLAFSSSHPGVGCLSLSLSCSIPLLLHDDAK